MQITSITNVLVGTSPITQKIETTSQIKRDITDTLYSNATYEPIALNTTLRKKLTDTDRVRIF
jgi:hypothetical protein